MKDDIINVDEKDFFNKTRVTALGFEVSEYQPQLVEGENLFFQGFGCVLALLAFLPI